jgi:hypothetical protein
VLLSRRQCPVPACASQAKPGSGGQPLLDVGADTTADHAKHGWGVCIDEPADRRTQSSFRLGDARGCVKQVPVRAARLTADVLTVTSGGSTFTLVRTSTVIIGACTSSTVRGFGAK